MTDVLDDDDEDLGAELDDGYDPADDDAGGEVPAGGIADYFSGSAAGGPAPYPGRQLVSRFPSGILLVDKQAGRAWLYDYEPAAGTYRCRDDAGAPLDPAGRWRAAEGPTYEVRSYDPDFAGDPLPGTGAIPAGGGGDYDEVS